MDIELRTTTVEELRLLDPMPSGYVTDRVYRVVRTEKHGGVCWELQEHSLSRHMRKRYDLGKVDDWIESYTESAPAGSLRFLGAFSSRGLEGVVTWQNLDWNQSIWLHDIRIREDMRRARIGSALMARLKDVAGELSARGIQVETQLSNFPALRFYLKHGFAFCGLNDHLYTNHDLETQEVAVFLFWEAG